MKCPEAVEWMHRYLDGDLSVEESDLLIEHLRSCDECAEAFGLLKHLSDNLYQLPDVTPKFSIVDSILPRLEEIDRARAEEGSALEVTEPAVPLMRTVPNKAQQTQRSSFWQRSSRTWIGGVAAAAVILGLFIYQYEPKTLPNAEIASTGTSSQIEKSITEDSNAAGSAASDIAIPSTDQDQTPKSGNGTAPAAGNEQENSKTDLQAATPKKSDGKTDGGDVVSPKQEGSSGQSSVPQKEILPSPKKGSASTHNKTAPATDSNSSSVSNSSSAEKANPKKPADSQGVQENQVADVPDNKATATGPVTNPNNSFMGITSFPPIKVSPDGKYTAEVEQNHLKIYANDGQNRTLLSDISLIGDWVKGEWSEDSKVFHYQTTKDEITKDYSFNAADSDKEDSTNSSQ
ncbi:anti-sigma factor family protein [Paenibacillus sp. SN-8-1]|uniref:anti-sigma factor family protein n=1 Tax=Paenibacillus sp. SN-8-1 TaxID=3435409 RepID=UPI003D9A3C26